MTPFEAYRIYVGMHAYLSSDTYDLKKYGLRTNVKESSFFRRNDAAFFYTAAKRYPTEREWVSAIIACYLKDKNYIIDILDSAQEIEDHQSRIENLPRLYQNDLRHLLGISKKLDYIFISNYDSRDPVVIQEILNGSVSIESGVIMNSVFRWIEKAQSSDTLLWPNLKKKILKYRPFLRYDKYKYYDLTEKVITRYV